MQLSTFYNQYREEPLKGSSKHLHCFIKYSTFRVFKTSWKSENHPSLAHFVPMIAYFCFKNRNLKHKMLNTSRSNEDILMKLSVDLSNDVIIKFWWLHGHGTKSMVATPTLLRAMPLSNKLQKLREKIKKIQKFFLHVLIQGVLIWSGFF